VEYWELDRNAGNDVSVTLHWNDSAISQISDASELLVARYGGGQWNDEGNGGFIVNGAAGTVSSLSSIANFGAFTIGTSTNNNFLPVELLEFKAELLQNNLASLTWRTASELNNKHFEIYRSIDGVNWELIGYRDAARNSSEVNDYNFPDDQPLFETTYYRLKQVDYNGDFAFSNVISLAPLREDNSLTIYPNPATSSITVQVKENARVDITTITGEVLISKEVDQSAILDISQLPSGIYFINTLNGYELVSEKLIKL
jgi:hypothetical protein